MRLLDLDPRWLDREEGTAGFVFKSPGHPGWWQSCFFQQTPMKEQMRLFAAELPREESGGQIQPCNPKAVWKARGPLDFATLTIVPSLDGSKGGLWHGFITNGEIVGGLT